MKRNYKLSRESKNHVACDHLIEALTVTLNLRSYQQRLAKERGIPYVSLADIAETDKSSTSASIRYFRD